MKTNTRRSKVRTHEGATAQNVSSVDELRRTLMTCLLFEDTFYESGNDIAERLSSLVRKVPAQQVAGMALEARSQMQIRHAPLFILRELARMIGTGPIIASVLPQVIQRADDMTEFVAMYLKDRAGKPSCLTAGIKRGLATAFRKFSAYQLAKYNRRDQTIKLTNVLFLCHAKPRDRQQAATWKKLINGQLESPDTWEVALSAGKDKKETWERLLREKTLGGMATLRNLRNMQQYGVDESLIRARLSDGISRALPFRFLSAARYAPSLEDAIEAAMFKAIEGQEQLPGKTGLLIDVSGSMEKTLSDKSEVTRMDAACGIAILLREMATVHVSTFSYKLVGVPARRGLIAARRRRR